MVVDSREILPNAAIPLPESVAVEYTYRRRMDASERGLTYVVSTTDDLTNPSWSAEAVTEVDVTPLDAEFERVTLQTAEGTQGFIKLEILMELQ